MYKPSWGKLVSPFPYFGGKRSVASEVWAWFDNPKHYIEPFCGSAAVLLAAPHPAALEVICDGSGFIANFWRAVKHQPAEVAEWAANPVSHIDLGARHAWLMEQRTRIGNALRDIDWPGDAKVAGWWLWGQCSWIADGWCEWDSNKKRVNDAVRQSIQADGKIPALGAGSGLQTVGVTEQATWIKLLSKRLARVRIVHGDWKRCLNSTYGGAETAVFLDPPYRSFEKLYGVKKPVADEVEDWARANGKMRIALCGLKDDYDLPGWQQVAWSRKKATYSGTKTTGLECIWYSPSCVSSRSRRGAELPLSAGYDSTVRSSTQQENPMTVKSEILEATDVKKSRGDSDEDFLNNVAKAVSDLPDKDYNGLSKEAKKWAVDAINKYNEGETVPDFPEDESSERPRRREPEPEPERRGETRRGREREPEPEPERRGRGREPEPETTRRGAGKTKPEPAAKAKGSGNGPSGVAGARQMLAKNPGMSLDDLVDKAEKKGLGLSRATLNSTRSGFLQDVKALQEEGLLKRSLI